MIRFDEFASHVRLFVTEEHAVGEKDGAAAGLWVQTLENVLEESVVGSALRGCAEEVAIPWITRPRFAVPLLDRVWGLASTTLNVRNLSRSMKVDCSEYLPATI